MHLYEKVGEFVTTSMYFSDLGIWQSQFLSGAFPERLQVDLLFPFHIEHGDH